MIKLRMKVGENIVIMYRVRELSHKIHKMKNYKTKLNILQNSMWKIKSYNNNKKVMGIKMEVYNKWIEVKII